MVGGAAELSRLQRLFSLSVPPLVFLAMGYVGLSNSVFGLAHLVGKRLAPSLRRPLRTAYVGLTGLVAATAHIALVMSCASLGDPCSERSAPLQDAHCFGASSAAVVFLLCTFAVDRVFVPLLDVQCDACALSLRARAARAAAVAVVWMSLAESCSATIPLLLLLTARRALCRMEVLDALAGTALKAYASMSAMAVVGGACAGSKRLTVAATAAVFLS